MSKVIVDEKLIDKFLTRGVEAIYPSAEELKKKLLSGEQLKIYQGFDPTGPYLHVGHAIGIRALRILQQLGHQVVFLIGDFTAKVGDPDKDKTRQLMSEEEIEKNMAGWKEQAAQLIDFEDKNNPVVFDRNFNWLSKLTLYDVIGLMSHITVQRMLERDMFDRRIKEGNPIRLQEFIYPLMQGYDGVAMEVDMEIGGADQTFNMLVGRDLSRAYLKKEKFVRTNKMMDAPDGRTMSKTKGNGINLADTPDEMYGKAMSYPDSAIASGFELLTEMPMETVARIEGEIREGANPMQFKQLMAFEIVKTIKGEQEALAAEAEFKKVFQKKEKPSVMPEVKLKELSPETLVEIGAASSKGEAKRLMEQGGVKLNDEKKSDWKAGVALKNGDIIQVGPRKFYRVK